MQTNNKNIIIFILVIIVAVVALVFISKDKDSSKKTDQFTVNQICSLPYFVFTKAFFIGKK